jgi:hypothetical protein
MPSATGAKLGSKLTYKIFLLFKYASNSWGKSRFFINIAVLSVGFICSSLNPLISRVLILNEEVILHGTPGKVADISITL